jgi:hypothetical protein
MSLLDKASLIVTPNAYKESKLYSVVPNTTLGDMTVVRATTATRVNSAGLIEVVPRNLLTYSEQFENANWVKSATGTASAPVVSTDSVISPINIQNAEKITFDLNGGTSSSDLSWIYQNVNTTIGLTYTFSAYVKASTIGDIGKQIRFGGITYSNTITLTDNWQRVLITQTATIGTSTSFGFRLRGTEITNDVSMDLWGAQVENFATATEYFPTTTRLNIPRIDYSNGSCPSLLVEPQRTNLILRSDEFDNAYWTKLAIGGTISLTPNYSNSPSGILNADRLLVNTVGSAALATSPIVVTNAVSYTMSMYIKSNTASSYVYQLRDGYSGVVSSNLTITPTWQRFTLTFTSIGTLAELQLRTLVVGASDISIWGAQLEASSYATSYIPTVASTVTRNADVISKTGISSLIGQTEGTFFTEFNYNGIIDNTTSRKIISLNDGTSNNLIDAYIQQGFTTLQARLRNGGVGIGSITSSALSSGNYKVAYAYKNSDFVLYINGTQIGSVSSGTISFSSPVGIVQIGDGEALSDQFGGLIKSAQLYKTRLTNAELAQLTTL